MKFLAMLAVFLLFASVPATARAAVADPVSSIRGDITVTSIQDAAGAMPLDIFKGAPEADLKKFAPEGTVQAGVTVFLIQYTGADKKNILVDTGYGSPKGALLEGLAKLGLKPENIDEILLTHMHGDHIGGLVDGETPVYPTAKILVSKPELAFWTDPKILEEKPDLARTAEMARNVQKVYGDRLVTFTFGEEVLPGISALASIGHTPGHTAFLLTIPGKTKVVYSGKNMGHGAAVSKDQQVMFWGDLVHGAAIQFPLPDVCARYDMDVAEAVEARKTMMGILADKKIPVAGAHLPFPAIGRVERKGNGFTFVPMK